MVSLLVLPSAPLATGRVSLLPARSVGGRCPCVCVCVFLPYPFSDDIAWDTGRLTVRSPKTARHQGHAVRLVPICPELRSILVEAYEQAAVGDKLILPRMLTGAANLRTTFTKIITRSGHKPWPRLFQNLRASCATDWVKKYPNHVVAKWLAHSPMIAATHYLQARERHFEDVVNGAVQGGPEQAKPSVHICVQSKAATRHIDSHESKQFGGKRLVVRNDADCCEPQQTKNGQHRTRTCDLHGVNVAL